jgi:hypothetical protein
MIDDYTDEVVRRTFGLADRVAGLAERLVGLLERWEVAGVAEGTQTEEQAEEQAEGLLEAVAGYCVTDTWTLDDEDVKDPELPATGPGGGTMALKIQTVATLPLGDTGAEALLPEIKRLQAALAASLERERLLAEQLDKARADLEAVRLELDSLRHRHLPGTGNL